MLRLKVPATSANLGSGFDALGIALSLYNTVEMEEWDGVDIASMDGLPIPTGEENLIYQTAMGLFRQCGRPFSGLRIRQENSIPMARGLGSSSACIVAGLMGANRLMGDPLTLDDLVSLAAALEGHPDNSTPALVGGMAAAVLEGGKVFYVKQSLPDDLQFAAIVPDFELRTSLARSVMPGEIPHGDAVYNLSRAALMALSLCSGRYENLAVAAGDRLHQPYRMSLIPGGAEVLRRAQERGAYASYISGAGSSLMAILPGGREDILAGIREDLDSLGHQGWRLLPLTGDNQGAAFDERFLKTPNCR